MTDDKRVYLFDTTLRDGAQTQGVDFSVADKVAIAQELSTNRIFGLREVVARSRQAAGLPVQESRSQNSHNSAFNVPTTSVINPVQDFLTISVVG